MKRVLFVLVDGLGDVGCKLEDSNEIFDPLEAAKVPNMSRYFNETVGGRSGLMDPVEPGVACGSDTAHLSIFGFDPKQ